MPRSVSDAHARAVRDAEHREWLIETGGIDDGLEICNPPLERQAGPLLILGRPATMKGYELFAGAKLFGYLKAGRPIVGILPEDETKNILRRLGVSTLASLPPGVPPRPSWPS